MRLFLPIVLFVGAAAGACASEGAGGDGFDARRAATEEATKQSEAPMDDDAALAFLERECASCHGIDKVTGAKADYYSAWPLPAEGITRSFLEIDELTPVAYQTIRHAALAETESPSPMPPEVTDQKKIQLKSVIDWFQRKVPYAVIDADARYGNESASKEKVLLQFSCAKPSTLRTYLGRVTFGAFDRPPTPEELGWFSEAELAAAATKPQRDTIVAKFDDVWKSELIDVGLRKLATAVGGGPGIRASGVITDAVAADLREELYRSYVTRYDTASWSDYFTANTVMATPNTAPFYGCTVSEGWQSCNMQPPRGGFFTTLGFLNSRPQSFLVENNNHGRVASLYFTVYGEQLLAATDGPTGEGTPPLPSCLEAIDTRKFRDAPRGSAAIPEFGKVCQSCHLSRHMAAGSMLFRPFATNGLLYSPATLGTATGADSVLLAAALDPSWTYTAVGSTDAKPVDRAFIDTLLRSNPKPCISTGKPANPTVTVASVGELAQQLISNQSSFARGFMRHAHRAFSNLPTINLEMGLRALDSFEAGKSKLPDLIKAYFGTDTLACEADQQ